MVLSIYIYLSRYLSIYLSLYTSVYIYIYIYIDIDIDIDINIDVCISLTLSASLASRRAADAVLAFLAGGVISSSTTFFAEAGTCREPGAQIPGFGYSRSG